MVFGEQAVHQPFDGLHIGLALGSGRQQCALIDRGGELAAAFGDHVQQRQLQLARDLLGAEFEARVVAADDELQPVAIDVQLVQMLHQLGGPHHAGNALVADHPDLAGMWQHVLDELG